MKRPDTSSGSLVQVGAITAAHGIRGQVKLRSFTQTPEDIFSYSPITDLSGTKEFVLTYEGYKEQLFIASIAGVTDRNHAELLKGTALYATVAEEKPLGENQWLYSDLQGLEARTENGRPYGKVLDVFNFGAGDIIEIQCENGKSEMLPFSSVFVGEVKVPEGYLVVFPPDYLDQPDEEAQSEAQDDDQ